MCAFSNVLKVQSSKTLGDTFNLGKGEYKQNFLVPVCCRYGDKAPKTILGKLLGMVWMLAGLIITTVFISIITTSLTSVSLEGRTNLRGVAVGMALILYFQFSVPRCGIGP